MFEISKKSKSIEGVLKISGSKSESNRLLALRAFANYFEIDNFHQLRTHQLFYLGQSE